MEKKTPRPMTPFDELTTPYPLSILKLLLPYLVSDGRSPLWILIKFMELQYTVSLFRHPGAGFNPRCFDCHPDSPSELLDELAPYLPPEQAQVADTFRNALNMIEMMKMFQSSDNDSYTSSENTDGMGSPFAGMNPMDLMTGMLSPDQQEMFQMYQEMFSNTETQTNSMTGDDSNGSMDQQSASEKYGSGETGADSDGRLSDEREIRKGSGADHAGSDHECQ